MSAATVDRTPKPCNHKVANHQHGTRAAYVLDQCRCEPCTVASREAEAWRRRQRAYGRYDKYVDAGPVRDHVRELMAAGMGLKRIIAVTGIPSGTLWKLVYGKHKPDGSRSPSKRVTRETAEKILGTKPDLAAGALSSPEAADEARTRLRSLVALGWSMRNIAGRLGVESGNQFPLFHGERVFTCGRVAEIDALFNELSMSIPPHATHRERQVFSRSKNYAAARGWLPPLALEDVTGVEVDDTELDEVAVQRRLSGDTSVSLNRAERAAVVREAFAAGWSYNQIETRAGISKPDRYRLAPAENQEQAS